MLLTRILFCKKYKLVELDCNARGKRRWTVHRRNWQLRENDSARESHQCWSILGKGCALHLAEEVRAKKLVCTWEGLDRESHRPIGFQQWEVALHCSALDFLPRLILNQDSWWWGGTTKWLVVYWMWTCSGWLGVLRDGSLHDPAVNT